MEAKYYYYKSVQLTQDWFPFGRMNNGHLINLDYMPKSCMFDNLSRKHFVIKKHSDRVTLTDHSHWGTYIQKSKVGKVGKVWNGKFVDLELGDIISVYKADHTCFQFKLLSEEESEGNWMPNGNVSMNASLPTRRNLVLLALILKIWKKGNEQDFLKKMMILFTNSGLI